MAFKGIKFKIRDMYNMWIKIDRLRGAFWLYQA